jgi:hypothetical protein
MKTPAQQAKHLNNEIGSYAANFLCNLIIRMVSKMNDPEKAAFDCLSKKDFDFKGEFDSHLTGYDLQNYFREVKKELKWI